MLRRSLLLAAAAVGAAPRPAAAVDRAALDLAVAAITANDDRRRAAIAALIARGKPDVSGALIDLMLYYPDDGDLIAEALRRFSGQAIGTDWFQWMLWLEGQASYASFDG